MVTSAELNLLTVKQLGVLAKELAISGWHEMRKEELVRSLVVKSRSRGGRERLQKVLQPTPAKATKGVKSGTDTGKKATEAPPSKQTGKPIAKPKKAPPTSGKAKKKESTKEVPKRKETPPPKPVPKVAVKERVRVDRNLSTQLQDGKEDRLVLLVRDPYWLHAYWELGVKTVERAKVAMGHHWYTAVPAIRLFRLSSDGTTYPKRFYVRDVFVHGGVNNWYLDVQNPPSMFQAELGYLSREKKFYSIMSSNTVETPQRQIVDELDKLDGNWRGVADDLGRIYKLSGGDGNNQELRRVFEEQLGRPMSAPLLSRYRASQQGAGAEKTRRNFQFQIDADIIIHGKTDPSVQVTIRNEPIKINDDGTFSVRFSIPEKRHVFPIEAEGSDGVETQRVILTMERNTRVLETLFQEHTEED